MSNDWEGLSSTDAGMSALWVASAFPMVVDYDSWEAELLEDVDLRRHIRRGALVPISVGGDGAFQVAVRVASAQDAVALSARERRVILATSEPYLLVSDGQAIVSGLEGVGSVVPTGAGLVAVPSGRWSVTVHLIDWKAEADSVDVAGRPNDGALADFVLLMNPVVVSDEGFRDRAETFDR